ncbi:DUF3324 domain-containing protein [Enterococcus faecalis]|uniref:DUF3324 domain-containing protein n=1 Tax=Enterococcus faecalis TaxID=1351 RepID=UPI00039BDE34|nr:DUF3324 domain-containing protein [Enterococcus faecalis]
MVTQKPTIKVYCLFILLCVINSSSIIISRVKATVTVKKKGEEKPLFTQKKEQLSFAPIEVCQKVSN